MIKQNLILVEYVEAAVDYLKLKKLHEIGITSISKEAEYALLAVSKISNITCFLC